VGVRVNYAAHYQALISRAEGRELTCYVEKHHVVPRCLDKKSKYMVKLTPEEHYTAHILLVKMNPGHWGLVVAARRMTTGAEHVPRKNKCYGWLRRAFAKAVSELRKGTKLTEAQKEQLRRPWSAAHWASFRNPLKGTKWSPERHLVHTVWNKGKDLGPLSDEQKAVLSAAQLKSYEEHPERGSNHSAAMKRHFDTIGRKPPRAPRPSKQFVKGQEAWNKGVAWSDEVLVRMRKPRSLDARANIKAAAIAREEKRKSDPVAYAEFCARKAMVDSAASKAAWERRKAANALLSPELKTRQEIMRLQKKLADLQAQIDRESEVA
jgi:hypothetical protein